MSIPSTLTPAAASDLRASLRIPVIGPRDDNYDAARTLFYSGFDRRPLAIVRPADATEVARAVRYARDRKLPLAVRCGGHSPAGHSMVDGALVIDLSALKGLEVDAERGVAWAGAGLTAGEYTAAVAAHGLVTGFGDTPSVGIGGITLGGGVGFLHRKLGLTIDSVLAVEIVTADGEILHADERSHPELFWAVRGGGGNFGVVTRIRYRLHRVDEATGGVLILPASPEIIERFFALHVEASEDLSGMSSVMLAPPMPFIPAEHHGRPILFSLLVHAGPAAEGERVLAPFRALAPPIADMLRPMRYAQIYEGGMEPPKPKRVAVHSTFTDRIDRAAGEAILDHLHRSRAPMRVAQMRVMGGAVARVPADATAFIHRDRPIMAMAAAAYDEAEEGAEHAVWTRALAGEMRRGAPGAYIGFLGEVDEAGVREAYPEPAWSRLRRIKSEYDPGNLFRFNQNIPPASEP